MRASSIVPIAVLSLISLAATSADHPTTGTTREQPLAEDVCPEQYPELDPSDPAGTLYGPEPAPEHDLCRTWITAHWDDVGPDATLTAVTFGLEVLGDVTLRPDHAYAFSWESPASWDPEYRCRAELLVTDGSVRPAVAYRSCRTSVFPLVDWMLRVKDVHGKAVPEATVAVDGAVLEVTVPITADLIPELRDELASGATLEAVCPLTVVVDPLAADALHAGDVTLTPPEEA